MCGESSRTKFKKVWRTDEVGLFFVTGATDADGKLSHFFCRVCRKDVSVLTHGPHEVLRHFQRVKHSVRDQQLRLETPGWRVLDFQGIPFSESELEHQRQSSWSSGHSGSRVNIAEDLFVDESGAPDATLPVLAKVLSLIEVLRLTGFYELVYQLWSQFTLTASRMNTDAKWFRDELLVSNFLFHVSTYQCSLAYWCCILVDHSDRDIPSHPFSCVLLGAGT